MSEYQYYEFVAVDRPLDEGQLRELHALSTRAQITSTSFVYEYHWGDFRGDPRTLMERYFDAFLYLANWGTRRLMIRLPATLLDAAGIRRAERERLAAERQAQQRARREREAAVAREERLESLAHQEEQAWQRVSALIDTKKQGEYDIAVALLRDLQAVGERKDRAEVFDRRVRQLRDAHRRKPSLMDRFDLVGLGQ